MDTSFLKDMAMVLGVAATTGVIARSLKMPPILGYMIAGLAIGPYLPIPLFADHHRVESLSEFGVVLVMFAVGLEFRLKRFFKVIPTSGVTAAFEIVCMAFVGISFAHFLGWNSVQALFLGGALAISSTMVVSKIFEGSAVSPEAKAHVFGILVIQDIVAVLILTLLGAIAAGSGLEAGELVPKIRDLFLVLFGTVAFGLFFVPRLIRKVHDFESTEVTTIVVVGLCFSLAAFVGVMGFSVALGAFLAGVLVAESGQGTMVEHLIKPLKDVFAAVFFVSVGMTVNPVLAFEYLPTSLALTALVLIVQFLSVSFAGLITGCGFKTSVSAALSLGQIGEFSFIIASIGVGAGLLPKEFQTIIVSVAVLSSCCTPVLWSRSEKIMGWVDGLMPRRLRMMVALYEDWFSKVRSQISAGKSLSPSRKVLGAISVDVLLLVVLPPIFLKFFTPFVEFLETQGMGRSLAVAVVGGIYILVLLPLVYLLSVNLSRLIARWVEGIFPNNLLSPAAKQVDTSKKLFQVTIQIGIFLLVGTLIWTGLKAFVPPKFFWSVFGLALVGSLFKLWTSAGKVQEDVFSGGEKLIDLLSRQSFPEAKSKKGHDSFLSDLNQVQVTCSAVDGQTLAELNIRASTGATVVAIHRNQAVLAFPSPKEKIFLGDLVQVSGEAEAVRLCREKLSLITVN